MAISFWLNPTELITKAFTELAIANVKAPAASVVVPPFAPFTATEAPCKGAPFASVIVPVIVLVCEKANCVNDTHTKRKEILLSNRFMVIINGLSN